MVNKLSKLDAFILAACEWTGRILILVALAALAVGAAYCLYTFIAHNVTKFFTL
uniref:Uncharacterized protein n=1 Tax=feces metagenome TaxID=1861841 RepID=A0A7M2QM14_9ZZZZ